MDRTVCVEPWVLLSRFRHDGIHGPAGTIMQPGGWVDLIEKHELVEGLSVQTIRIIGEGGTAETGIRGIGEAESIVVLHDKIQETEQIELHHIEMQFMLSNQHLPVEFPVEFFSQACRSLDEVRNIDLFRNEVSFRDRSDVRCIDNQEGFCP